MFGDDFLVAPIYKDTKTRNILLPEGKWRYFFDDKEVLKGPMEFEKEFSMEEFPLYIKEGAIVPMHINREYTGLGDRESNGFTTI